MTKTEIIDELYRSKRVSELFKKIPECFADDLKQEVFMLILIRPESEIIEIHSRGKIYSFFSKLCYNQLFWGQSKFHKLYNTYEKKEAKGLPCDNKTEKEFMSLSEGCNTIKKHIEIPDIEPDFDINEEIEDAMSSLSSYHNTMLRLYAEHGTYRATGEAMGIAWKSVYNAVKAAKIQVKGKIKL